MSTDRTSTVVTELELMEYVRNGVVKKLSIIEDEAGKYQVHVKMSWKKEECVLITIRRHPRTWVSLDRLARHIKTKYEGTIPLITLSFLK